MKTLFFIEGQHRYFGPGGGAGVRCVPTRRSRFIAEKAGLHFFPRASGLRVCFDPTDFPKLNAYAEDRVEPLVLTFLVMADRDDFLNYTELPEVPKGRFLMGTNRNGGFDSSFCARKSPAEHALVDASTLMAEGSCTAGELASSPVVLVRLDYSLQRGRDFLQEALDDAPRQYTLCFKNRKTFWRYFIPCDVNPEHLVIDDRDGSVSFGLAGGLKAPGHLYYARFVSDRPLGLQWKGAGRFQLKCTGGGRTRTLVKALPNAPSDPLHCMDLDSGKVFVSDIFVNHYVYGR